MNPLNREAKEGLLKTLSRLLDDESSEALLIHKHAIHTSSGDAVSQGMVVVIETGDHPAISLLKRHRDLFTTRV